MVFFIPFILWLSELNNNDTVGFKPFRTDQHNLGPVKLPYLKFAMRFLYKLTRYSFSQPFCLLWLIGIASGLFTPAAYAETSLWRISKGENRLFIGGTIHLLSQSDYPFPDEFEQVFREIDTLVLETDLEAFTKPELQATLLRKLTYQDGTRLQSKLNAKTYRALAAYCKSAGIPLSSLQHMKPVLAVLTLTIMQLKQLDMADTGVDQFFLKKAKTSGKKVAGLEAAEAQIEVLEHMGQDQENELILSTISELKTTPQAIKSIKSAWRSGNLKELEATSINSMQTEFPHLRKNLLTRRNNAWLPQIKTMLETPDKELILVGALHLAGEDGLIALLKKLGYSIEQY